MDQTALENPMRQVRIGKVVVNSSIGEGGARLEKAMKILEGLTGQKPSVRKAKKTIRGFGIRRGEPIAAVVTLRRQRAEEFLKRAFAAVGNRIKQDSFDEYGNFSFGIKEHLEFPGTRYDPDLGIIGMDIIVHLVRPGHRVATRRIRRSKIGKAHRLTRDEGVEFVRNIFGVRVE